MNAPQTLQFIIRPVNKLDIDDLLELSKLMQLLNLPPDRDIISHRIKASMQAFQKPYAKLEDNFYFFVLEDLSKNKVVGVSMIHAQHGTRKEPHFYLRVKEQEKISKTLNIRHIHRTLKLGHDTDGPTEIGGLVLHPDYRNNKVKLGKQLSFSRFLYMALHPERFKATIHSELMPPFNSDGKSPLWEALGRRFLQMEYIDADALSRRNKEFILSLFPNEAIYETLLTDEARSAIGQVGPETQPVKKMLEDIGFHYIHEVDPFDGGPHYRAQLSDIKVVKELKKITLSPLEIKSDSAAKPYLCAFHDQSNQLIIAAIPLILQNETYLLDQDNFNYLHKILKSKDVKSLEAYSYPI